MDTLKILFFAAIALFGYGWIADSDGTLVLGVAVYGAFTVSLIFHFLRRMAEQRVVTVRITLYEKG